MIKNGGITYSSSPEFDKKQSEYLDLADNISTQNPKQSDILEALDLITPKQKTIEEVKKGEEIIRKTIDTYLANPSMLNDVSFEEIDENLKQLVAGIPESVMYVLESEDQEDPEAILDGSTLQKMLSSNNDTTIDSLPSGDEEQEDTEVTESGIQKAGDKGLLALPVSSNDCALALSDCREKECLALGDGSKDEEDDEGYNSGSEEEEETIEQLSDSDGGNLETTAIDTAISLEQEAKKEMQTQISENEMVSMGAFTARH